MSWNKVLSFGRSRASFRPGPIAGGGGGGGGAGIPSIIHQVSDAAMDIHVVLWGDGTIKRNIHATYGSTPYPSGNNFVAVAAGYYVGIALRDDGTAEQFGYVSNFTLPESDYVQIDGGDNTLIALRANGDLRYTHSQAATPSDLVGQNIKAAYCGGHSKIALLKADGTIGTLASGGAVTWYPELGSDFVQCHYNYFHLIGLKSDGTIVAHRLQAGGADPIFPNTYKQIAATKAGYAALNQDGSIECVGNTAAAPAGNDWVQISGGYTGYTATKADGYTVTWDCNRAYANGTVVMPPT